VAVAGCHDSPDLSVVENMSTVMFNLLQKEQLDKNPSGDHFAKQVANRR
jgi:hypothetical protein